MKLSSPPEYFRKNESIFIKSTTWLVNNIDVDGFVRINREADVTLIHQGKKAKVIGIEALNDEYCAVHIADWEDDDRSAKKRTNS